MHSRELWKSIKLPFQKLDTMLLNDIRLFIRDRKSLVLVMLTPFLILSILINIFYFSDVADTIRGVKLGVCDRDNSDFALESEIFDVIRFEGNCEKDAVDAVSSGDIRAAVVIPEGFKKNLKDGKGTELRLFVDNSKSTTAIVASNAMKAYVSDLNEKIGTAFILEAWEQLKELNENLRFLVNNLEKAKPVAIELQAVLNDLNVQLSGIDFSSQQQSISDLVTFLDLLEFNLDEVNRSFAQVPEMEELPFVNLSSGSSLAIEEYRVSSGFMKGEFCNSSLDLPFLTENPICSLFNKTDSLVESLDSDASKIAEYENTVNIKIFELNHGAYILNDTLSKLSVILSSNSGQNQELRQKIALVRENLIFIQDRTENITETMMELNSSVDKFLGDIIRVTDELNKTIDVLDAYTKKDPSSILRPVRIEEKPVFKEKLEIFYRLPSLVSIILLFITLFIASSLVVNERKGGTMARIFLSPISMFFYVFEKMIYLLVLSIMAALSMLVATLIFKVPMEMDPQLLVVTVVASLVYISIGMFVGSVSKSENTSLLTCLVVGFPLMFLCGAFSPPELMSKFMRIVSAYLPLTMNISLIEKITIYHTGIDLQMILIMLGIVAVFYVASVLLIRKNPTLK